jgi:hypothetical protein
MADPSSPPIPSPLADVGSLAFVSLALRQRVQNITDYVLTLGGGAVTATNTGSGTSTTITNPYVLPVASVSVLGGVKVDGVTVSVVAGVLSAAVPSPAVTLPVMDGTAAIGALARYARADHVHPRDTSLYPNSNPSAYVSLTELDARLAAIGALVKPSTAGMVVTGSVPVEIIHTADGQPVYIPL